MQFVRTQTKRVSNLCLGQLVTFSYNISSFWAAAPKGPVTNGTTRGDSGSTFLRFYVSPFLCFSVSMSLRFYVSPFLQKEKKVPRMDEAVTAGAQDGSSAHLGPLPHHYN